MTESEIQRLREAAERVFAGTRVLCAYAHGSRVSGRPRPDSDLDLGYYLAGWRSGERLSVRAEMEMADRLSAATGFEVDLRNLGAATLELRGRVLEEGIRVYSGDHVERVALERGLLGRYHDYKDIFRRMHEVRLARKAAKGV